MPSKKELIIENFNLRHEVGTPVRYWPGGRDGESREIVTTSEADLLGGHTPVVFVQDAGAIALTHIEVIEPEAA
jgi:hypothetical protein